MQNTTQSKILRAAKTVFCKILMNNYDEYGAAPYIGGWSWTNYGAAEAAPAV